MSIALLVFGPHPDDIEIGLGGTIARHVAAGDRVGLCDLTAGEMGSNGTIDERLAEAEAARAVLGALWRTNLRWPDRAIGRNEEHGRMATALVRKVRPRAVAIPYGVDRHPDHVAASALVDAARFWAKLTKCDLPGEPHYPQRIVYYFSVHLRLHPRPSFVLDITPHLEDKMRAISCYHSQFIEGRSTTPPTVLDDLRDRARYWGWAIGTGYGEPFVCREEMGLRGLRDLA